jgi:hypothetical protein
MFMISPPSAYLTGISEKSGQSPGERYTFKTAFCQSKFVLTNNYIFKVLIIYVKRKRTARKGSLFHVSPKCIMTTYIDGGFLDWQQTKC